MFRQRVSLLAVAVVLLTFGSVASENIQIVATTPKTMRSTSTGAVDCGANQNRSHPARSRVHGAVIGGSPES